MRSVFITGIAGFIGFHTALKYKSYGFEVSGVDNFNPYYDPKLKHDRANILRENGIAVDQLDIREKELLATAMKIRRPTLVIHLAATAGVRVSMDKGLEYIDNNIRGTQCVIEACETVGIDDVIYASTSCVMEGTELPWRESSLLGPQLSPYGYSKQTNENQFLISKIKNAVGLRFFTVYGPYGRPDMALFSFVKNTLEGRSIDLYNYGDMKRDFTYVDDIVKGIFIVSNNMTERDVYCIGNGTQVELMDFVKSIEFHLDLELTCNFVPRHPADALETWSDTTKIQRLGYKSETPIHEGVGKFVEWYLEHYNI